MATLAERLEQLIPDGQTVASRCTFMPTLIAVKLPDTPSIEVVLNLPVGNPRSLKSASGQWQLTNRKPEFRFRSDGSVGVSDADQFLEYGDGTPLEDWFAKSEVLLPINGESVRYCVLAWTEKPEIHKPNWKRWCEFARKVFAVLRSDPMSAVFGVRWQPSVVLDFVFRAVIETAFVQQLDGYLEVSDLWGATLFALSPQKTSLDSHAVESAGPLRPSAIQLNAELERWCETLTSQGQAILRYLWERMDRDVGFVELLRIPGAFRSKPTHPDQQYELIKTARQRIITNQKSQTYDIVVSGKRRSVRLHKHVS